MEQKTKIENTHQEKMQVENLKWRINPEQDDHQIEKLKDEILNLRE